MTNDEIKIDAPSGHLTARPAALVIRALDFLRISDFGFRIFSCATLLSLGSCSMLNGPLDRDGDDAVEMQPHPRRTEMPSLFGPGSERLASGKFPSVKFNDESGVIPPSEESKVRDAARWLTGNPQRVLLSAGAVASSPEYSRQLSDQRAQSVRKALIAAGVPASKILTVSFGPDAPSVTGGGVSFSIIGTGEEPAR